MRIFVQYSIHSHLSNEVTTKLSNIIISLFFIKKHAIIRKLAKSVDLDIMD